MVAHLRLSKEELFVSNCVVVPTAKEDGLQPIDHTLLLCQGVDRMWPELGYKLYHRMCTIDNSCMRTVVDRKVERLWLRALVYIPSCIRLETRKCMDERRE